MKIAIQGHPTRGREVIQILKSLGGKTREEFTGRRLSQYYFINCNGDIDLNLKINLLNHKLYTLEEFEKEFPFKIGDEVIFTVTNRWVSGKVTGLTYVEDQLKYEIDTRIGGYRYVEPYKLQLYPMKEERNIILTLDKAKEWYKKGGELKEIALQVFTEKELTKVDLPKTWEEFCEKYPVKRDECILESRDRISVVPCDTTGYRIYKNWIVSQKSAEAHLAMIQLEQLRDCWRQGNIPQELKYKIRKIRNIYTVVYGAENAFLSFCDNQTAEEFLKCFRSLIEKAGDLI